MAHDQRSYSTYDYRQSKNKFTLGLVNDFYKLNNLKKKCHLCPKTLLSPFS
jgi:hypothetical protein